MALYSAAHKRHWLASDTVGYGSRSRWFLMNMYSGTASVCGCLSATIIAARHNSISNNADGVACTVRYVVALLVMAFIWAVKGRIPRSTGEYVATSDARHCQYRKVCGARKESKEHFFYRAVFWSDRSGGEVDMKS